MRGVKPQNEYIACNNSNITSLSGDDIIHTQLLLLDKHTPSSSCCVDCYDNSVSDIICRPRRVSLFPRVRSGQILHPTCTEWTRVTLHLHVVDKSCTPRVRGGQELHPTCSEWTGVTLRVYGVDKSCTLRVLSGQELHFTCTEWTRVAPHVY